MAKDATKVAVVGGGLSAHLCARTITDRGGDVLRLSAGKPGITSIWNGLGAVFGPPSPLPSHSAGAVERRKSWEPSFRPGRSERWERLLDRRGDFHPYRRLGLDRADVEKAAREARELLSEDVLEWCRDGSVLPGPGGQPAAPDLVFPSLAALNIGPGIRIGLLDAPGMNGWRADALAVQLRRANGIDATEIRTDLFDEAPKGHGVRSARWFENRWEDASGEIVEALGGAADKNAVDLLILPPLIGSDLETHRDIWAALESHVDVALAEFPAARDPVFGWRLLRHIRNVEGANAPEARATKLQIDDRSAKAITDDDGSEFSVDAVVLATGRWFSGGLPTEAPFVEPLSAAPVWIDGTPLPPEESLYPPDFLDALPWSDHSLLRSGLQTDSSGRVLCRDGRPMKNVFAIGRMLGGFNPFHDGCALGVELVTGRHVATTLAGNDERDDVPSDASRPKEVSP